MNKDSMSNAGYQKNHDQTQTQRTEEIQDESNDEGEKTTTTTKTTVDNAQLQETMEIFLRVTLAGLGGSLVGVAKEKQMERMRLSTGASAAASARIKRSPINQTSNLPLTWAALCIVFATLVETTRMARPSQWIVNQLSNKNDEDLPLDLDSDNISNGNDNYDPTNRPNTTIYHLCTVGDYTLGGGVAGIAGSFGRNAQLRERLPRTMFRGTRRFFGLFPGLALGFLAGTVQASVDVGQQYVQSLVPEEAEEKK